MNKRERHHALRLKINKNNREIYTHDKSHNPYNLAKSFYYALAGIVYALGHERNLRIHFAVAILVLYLSSRYYELTRTESALLIMLMSFVITCELINTAVEKTVDLRQPCRNPLAKIAKDIAAGAVLMSGISAVAVAVVLFWDIPTFERIVADIAARPLPWILASLVMGIWIFPPSIKPPPKSDV